MGDGIIEDLRESYRKYGAIRRVIKTQFGVASGATRLKAVPEWPTETRKARNYYEHLKLMAADNIAEQKSPEWWTHVLSEAAKELEKEGLEPGQITGALIEDFPLSERSIHRYLPEDFKGKQGPKGPIKKIATVAISEPEIQHEVVNLSKPSPIEVPHPVDDAPVPQVAIHKPITGEDTVPVTKETQQKHSKWVPLDLDDFWVKVNETVKLCHVLKRENANGRNIVIVDSEVGPLFLMGGSGAP